MKVVIVGGGQVGIYLASLLLELNHDVVVIEQRPKRIELLLRELPTSCVLEGNGAEPHILEAAGIADATVVAAVTGQDETNLVVATLARLEYGARRVVGRVNNPKNAWLFTPLMGVDAVANQADLIARLVAEEMSMGDMMTLLKLHGGQYSLVEREVDASSPIVGKMLTDIALPQECVLAAILRGTQLVIPHGDTTILAGDKAVAITDKAHLQELAVLFGEPA